MSRYPQLAQTAANVLVDIGETIHTTASPQEVSLLIDGTLAQESFARHACLQALQVRLMFLIHVQPLTFDLIYVAFRSDGLRLESCPLDRMFRP